MNDPSVPPLDSAQPVPRGFPIATTLSTCAGLSLFVGLVLIAYRSPNYLGVSKGETKPDPVNRLKEIEARNQAILEGRDSSTKMDMASSIGELLQRTASNRDKIYSHGKLPFPIEPDAKQPEKK